MAEPFKSSLGAHLDTVEKELRAACPARLPTTTGTDLAARLVALRKIQFDLMLWIHDSRYQEAILKKANQKQTEDSWRKQVEAANATSQRAASDVNHGRDVPDRCSTMMIDVTKGVKDLATTNSQLAVAVRATMGGVALPPAGGQQAPRAARASAAGSMPTAFLSSVGGNCERPHPWGTLPQ